MNFIFILHKYGMNIHIYIQHILYPFNYRFRNITYRLPKAINRLAQFPKRKLVCSQYHMADVYFYY